MATLYLTQFGGTGVGNSDIAQEPSLGTQTLTIGSETKSTAFVQNCRLIEISVDAICSIHFSLPDVNGNYTAATTSSRRLPADTIIYYGAQPNMKLSVISNT